MSTITLTEIQDIDLSRWLLLEERAGAEDGFRIVDIREICAADDSVLQYLAQQVLLHHGSPEMICGDCAVILKDLRHLGLESLADALSADWEEMVRSKLNAYLDDEVLPSPSARFNPRIGNWGEIISMTLLVDLEGFWMPIYKLRYREKTDCSPRLTDLCAIRCDEPRPLMCLGETKTHTSDVDLDLGVKGLNSLRSGEALKKPEILHFIAVHLYEQGKTEEAAFISRIRRGEIDPSRRFDLYLIHERASWAEEILERLQAEKPGEEIESFSVRVLLVDDLRALIDKCYDGCWRAVLELLR